MTANPLRLAFVSPRFPVGATVGGAETLLAALARRAALLGHQVDFLTTCARDHFTWQNEHPAGDRAIDGMTVRFFPVNEDRDLQSFAKAQSMISSGADVPPDAQRAWLSNGINSRAMTAWLARNASGLDRVITGPYLFGLTCAAAAVVPDKTLLLPCLHDEAFAYLSCFREMFSSVRGCIFNSEPERDLAVSLHSLPAERLFVVGMGLDPFESDPAAFGRSRGIPAPYIFYAGRREALKGTPLLVDYFAAFKARTGSPLRLVLAGTGSVERPRTFADHVLDVGFLGEQEKRDAMAGALVFAHPSVNESLSIVLLESWLTGTPALVHACGRVLVHQCRRSNGGLWFRNYPEFEEALLLLEKNPGLRDALGKAGRGMVEKEYSWQAVDEKLGAALAYQPIH